MVKSTSVVLHSELNVLIGSKGSSLKRILLVLSGNKL